MKSSFLSKTRTTMAAHKVWTVVIIIVVIIGGYTIYRHSASANSTPQYTVASVRIGTLMQTVTGTGQVSASNQTDITSQVSGTIQSIDARVGQHVYQGQLIATIDPTNASISLQNAKLSLAKLIEPPKNTDLSNAQNSLRKSYDDGFNSAAAIYLDLPTIMNSMKDLLYGQTGFLSDQKSSFLSPTAREYRNIAAQEYDTAASQYRSSLDEFTGLTRSSATSSIDTMLANTYTTIKDVAEAVTDAQNAVTFITTSQPDYDPKDASAAASNVNTWASQANGDLSNLISAQNSIKSSSNSLTTLQTGADPLDVQSAELSVQQAQQSYNNYFIRAPYEGIIGRIPVNVYGQAGGSTVIATIIGQQKIASVSLNEVDAAKVKSGQPVNITFDAIDGLNATGTVQEVDQVGTVSQGVVAYPVKILINTQDDRIRPGMSVNVTIITNQEDNVLLVPSSAIKTTNGRSMVQVLEPDVVTNALNSARGSNRQTGQNGSSTRRYGSQFGNQPATSTAQFDSTSSSTGQFASSTKQFGMNRAGNASNGELTFTVSTTAIPQQVPVTIGDSDDTNTVITGGLIRGRFVITRSVTSGGSSGTTAPSILSSFGGARGAGGGGARFGGAGR